MFRKEIWREAKLVTDKTKPADVPIALVENWRLNMAAVKLSKTTDVFFQSSFFRFLFREAMNPKSKNKVVHPGSGTATAKLLKVMESRPSP